MFTVALIGGDGAGKTTIARLLEKSSPFPVRYLYMGPSILSGNRNLPTTRLARFLKIYALRKNAERSGHTPPKTVSSHDFHYRPIEHGVIWKTLSLINRIAEASYRYLLSLGYQLRGYVVLYDRHYVFHAPFPCSNPLKNHEPMKPLTRLEYWFFHFCYPKPNQVIFLDAPSEILFQRKGEADIPYFDKMRTDILERGKMIDNFVRVDATQPIEKVLAEVTRHIIEFRRSRKR